MKKKTLIVAIVIGLLLALGGTVGALFMGILRIPGLKIGPQPAKKIEAKKDKPPTVAKITKPIVKPKPAPIVPPAPKLDPEKGYQKLAEAWSGMEPGKLKKAVEKWKPADVARVLIYLDDDKVGAVLAELDPIQSSAVMKEIEQVASKPPVPKPSI